MVHVDRIEQCARSWGPNLPYCAAQCVPCIVRDDGQALALSYDDVRRQSILTGVVHTLQMTWLGVT